MLAKNLKAGKYSDGIINYVFEGRELEHKDKQAHVMRASADLLLPFSAQDKEGIDELKREFNSRTSEYLKKNPDNKNALIGHQLLSFTPEDEKKLGPDGIKKALDDFIDLAGLEKTRYVSVGHRDTDNYHIHIVYHKVQNDLKKENDWKLNNKTIERGVALALKNKLTLVKDQDKVALSKGVMDIRIHDRDIKELRDQDKLFKAARNMHHLEKLLKGQGRSLEHLLDGRVRIDKKIHRNEDLSTVFYMNRNQVSKENQNDKKSENQKIDLKALGNLSKSLDYNFFKGKGNSHENSHENENAVAGKSKPVGMVIIRSEEGRASLRRKRRGKQYLLKNRKKDNTKDKGQKI